MRRPLEPALFTAILLDAGHNGGNWRMLDVAPSDSAPYKGDGSFLQWHGGSLEAVRVQVSGG